MVKEQAVKIQQVSPQLEMSKPAPHWSGTNSKLRNGSSLVCHGTDAIGKRVRIAANAFIFSVNRSHRLGCAEEGLQMMENSVEEIKSIRLCGKVSFDWLLAFHFLGPN